MPLINQNIIKDAAMMTKKSSFTISISWNIATTAITGGDKCLGGSYRAIPHSYSVVIFRVFFPYDFSSTHQNSTILFSSSTAPATHGDYRRSIYSRCARWHFSVRITWGHTIHMCRRARVCVCVYGEGQWGQQIIYIFLSRSRSAIPTHQLVVDDDNLCE